MSVLTLKQKQAKTNVKKKEQDKNKPLKRKSEEVQKQNALGNRAIEQQALKAKGKEKSKEVSSKKELSEKSEMIKTPTDPAKDKAFKSVIQHIKRSGKSQKKPDDIDKKESQIKKASVLEVSEQQKNENQKAHQLSIEKKSKEKNPEKDKFTAKSFKKNFKEQLDVFANKLPTSKAGAKNFKNTTHLEDLEKGIKDNTTTSIESVSTPLIGVISNEKNTTNDDIASPQSIPEIILGSTPAPINKKAATPKIKHSSEISMEKESKSLDETMKENDLTEEQLKNSNEPEFMEALDLKNEAQTKAGDVPNRYRIEESKTLSLAEKESGILGKQSFDKMVTSRSDNFGEVHKTQTDAQKINVNKRRLINGLFEVIYNGAKIAVSNRLNKITTDTDAFFEKGGKVAKAQKTFSSNVRDRLEGIYGFIDEGFTLLGRLGGGKSTAQKAKDIFNSEKKQFIETLNTAFDDIAGLIVKGLNDAISYIDTARKVTDAIYKNLDPSEQKLLADSVANMQARYDSLEETVNDKEKELAQSLAKKYKENIDSLKETFDKIEEDVSASFLEKAYDATVGVAKTILKLKNLILDLFSEIKPFISTIIRSPVSFVKKLFRGIGAGIDLFKENIKKHVLGGFVKWLTGAMGSMSINIPDDLFSLKGIFSLVMQVLGLGWDYLRKKAVKFFGEPIVKAMEGSVKIFKILRSKGIAGIWEYLKEQFNDLKKTIIDEIQSMLITQVLIAGVKWLVSLLIPGGGFVKAIMAIKDLIVFFVESAIMLIPSLISAIKSLASGNVKGVAKAVEKGLSTLIVLVINLFAKLIGLGGLAKKVMKIIERVRKRIDKAIDKLIYKAKKVFKGLVKKGKGKVKGKSKKGKIDKTLGAKLTFSAGKENHKLWITNVGGKVKVMVSSDNPGVIEKRLKGWDGELKDLSAKDKSKASQYIKNAKVLLGLTIKEAKEEQVITEKILKNKEVTPAEDKQEDKAEKETIVKEKQLEQVLKGLFDLFGDMDTGEVFDTFIRKRSIKILEQVIKSEEYKVFLEDYKTKHKKSFIANHIGIIRQKVEPLIGAYLRKGEVNIFDSTLKTYFEESMTKSKGTKLHTKYKPHVRSITIDKSQFIVTYSYDPKGDDAQKEFRVVFDFSKVSDTKKGTVTQRTEGTNLKLKEKGTRGATEGSGKLFDQSRLYRLFLEEKDKKIEKNATEARLKEMVSAIGMDLFIAYARKKVNYRGDKELAQRAEKLQKANLFDSAHIVADWFGGSGYRQALNLSVTSAEYNRIVMGDAEKHLAERVKKKGDETTFNLNVSATWDYLEDNEILKVVNEKSIVQRLKTEIKDKEVDQRILSQDAKKELDKVLQTKQDPRRVLNVDYSGHMLVASQDTLKKEIGCDIWMSSYFDFDKKSDNVCKH